MLFLCPLKWSYKAFGFFGFFCNLENYKNYFQTINQSYIHEIEPRQPWWIILFVFCYIPLAENFCIYVPEGYCSAVSFLLMSPHFIAGNADPRNWTEKYPLLFGILEEVVENGDCFFRECLEQFTSEALGDYRFPFGELFHHKLNFFNRHAAIEITCFILINLQEVCLLSTLSIYISKL